MHLAAVHAEQAVAGADRRRRGQRAAARRSTARPGAVGIRHHHERRRYGVSRKTSSRQRPKLTSQTVSSAPKTTRSARRTRAPPRGAAAEPTARLGRPAPVNWLTGRRAQLGEAPELAADAQREPVPLLLHRQQQLRVGAVAEAREQAVRRERALDPAEQRAVARRERQRGRARAAPRCGRRARCGRSRRRSARTKKAASSTSISPRKWRSVTTYFRSAGR